MKPESQCIGGAETKISDTHQCEHGQIGCGEEGLTGATALFIFPVMNPCNAEDVTFLCDIMTPENSR